MRPTTNQIREYIRATEHMIKFFNHLLEEEQMILKGPELESERLAELTELRMLARSDRWPLAVPNELICEDSEKESRAIGILEELVPFSVKTKKFLDFGCGEGFCVKAAQSLGADLSVGYDITENSLWSEDLLFSTELKTVKNYGPYDIIIALDVLDHSQNPVEALKQIKMMKEVKYGKVYVRCHPWTSRHATHLYKSLNRAYLHLVFKEEELNTLGLSNLTTKKVINPQLEYKKWFKEAGLIVLEEKPITQPIELFFTHTPAILRRIKENMETTEFPREAMEIQFIDFVLK